MPDTLDLAQRAELALHGVARTSDPDDEYLMWFEAHWGHRPPYLKHSGCDIECAPKFLDCLSLLRHACGRMAYLDVEQAMLDVLTGFLDPKEGLYCAKYNPKRPWHLSAYAVKGYETKQEDYAIPGTTGIMLTALVSRHALGITPCEDLIRTIARGLERDSIQKTDPATKSRCVSRWRIRRLHERSTQRPSARPFAPSRRGATR